MNESGHLSLSSGYSLPPIYFLDGQHFLPSSVTQRSGVERSPFAAKRSRGGTTNSFHLLRSGLFKCVECCWALDFVSGSDCVTDDNLAGKGRLA
jgi:hypothetical protein